MTWNIQGKTVVITGANAGLGFETAKEVAKRGASVVLACRNQVKGDEAAQVIKKESGNESVQCIELDLNSLSSVRAFADAYRAKNLPLHVLVNNAGIMATPYQKTEDGFESQFQVNHLGHFLLTNLLLDVLKASAPARIINLSSRAHLRWPDTPLSYDDFADPGKYDRWVAYGRSKVANILFTRELHRRLNTSAPSGITVNALHPGLVDTNLLSVAGFNSPSALSVADGARTCVYLVTSGEVDGESGGYYYECKPCADYSRISTDHSEMDRLWRFSCQLTDVPYSPA